MTTSPTRQARATPWDDSDYSRGYRDALSTVFGLLDPQAQTGWITEHAKRGSIVLGLPAHTLAHVTRYLTDTLGVQVEDGIA